MRDRSDAIATYMEGTVLLVGVSMLDLLPNGARGFSRSDLES